MRLRRGKMPHGGGGSRKRGSTGAGRKELVRLARLAVMDLKKRSSGLALGRVLRRGRQLVEVLKFEWLFFFQSLMATSIKLRLAGPGRSGSAAVARIGGFRGASYPPSQRLRCLLLLKDHIGSGGSGPKMMSVCAKLASKAGKRLGSS